MKTIKFIVVAVIAGFAFTACNSAPDEDAGSDTVIIREEKTTTPPDNTNTDEDEGSSVGFDVKTDEDGNVSGEMEGDIDLDKK